MRGANPYKPPFLQRHTGLRRAIAVFILITLPLSFPLIILLGAVGEIPKAIRDLWGIIIGDEE